MKIVDVEVIELRAEGRQGAYGGPYGVFVRIATDAGITGCGETDSMPAVVRAVIEVPFINEMMSGLKWVLLEQDPLDIEGLWTRMERATMNYSRDGVSLSAMAAIDIALWDIKGKALRQPVYELIGGARRKVMRAYATHPLGASLSETAAAAAKLCEAGFTAVKFGWHPLGKDIKTDEAIVRTLRTAIGDTNDLLIDGGLAFDSSTAIERCKRFEPYRLFWFEEPLPAYDYSGYAQLTSAVETPIAAGELASSEEELSRLVWEGKIDILQVDVSRVGISQALKVARFAAERGVPCVNHTYTYEINLAASLHVVAAIELTSLFEVQVTPNQIRDAVARNPIRTVDGLIAVPDGPGLGVELDEAALERFAVRG